jgi:hypothetical protein
MRRVIFAALCAVALTSVPATASAATNGQLVTVGEGALVTLNPDGSGYKHVFDAPAGSALSSPVWSPDGNRIAFVLDGRIKALVLASGAVTDLAAGSDPGWTPTGDVAFRRGQDLLAVPAGGGAERSLGQLSDTSTAALAWSPDGWIARTVGTDVRVDALDGLGEDTLVSGTPGAPEWSPDGYAVAYPDTFLGSRGLRFVTLDGDVTSLTGGTAATADDSAAWSPDGSLIAYWRRGAGGVPELNVHEVDTGSGSNRPTPYGNWNGLDWQPCVAGVTTSCVSARPSIPIQPFRCQNPTVNTRSGVQVYVPLACTGGGNGRSISIGTQPRDLAILSQPVHGTVSITPAANHQLVYRSVAGYTGPDTFMARAASFGEPSNDITVTVNVGPTLASLAAPKLNVTGQPKLDRHGRVVLRGTCTNACTAALRVSIRLNTGRVLKGRVVKASAPAGGTVRIRLQRAKLPRHRRIVAARISGTLTGQAPVAGKLPHRNFTLTLIP